jgi:hypothetical protein
LTTAGPSVVHETIDGEVVVVDLDKGLYFSIDGVGALVWGMVIGGRTVAEILAWGTEAFTETTAVDDIGAFLEDLKEKGLVVEATEPVAVADDDLPAAPAAYATPALHMYSDMEELLLLDPIHEVSDDAGWPHAPA